MNTLRFLIAFVVGTGALTAIAVLLALACRRLSGAAAIRQPRRTAPEEDANEGDGEGLGRRATVVPQTSTS